jgi:hypothetical protein
MVTVDPATVDTLFCESIAGRGTVIAGLSGWERQQQGGMFMAVQELRASRRKTSKPADYVLALFPTFNWYTVPDNARNRSVGWLFADAVGQFERSRGTAVLFPTVDGIFGTREGVAAGGLCQAPENTFDVFCCLTTIEHWERNGDGAWVNEAGTAEVVEWDVSAEQTRWKEQVRSVCIHRHLEYSSLERLFAFEALEGELVLTNEEKDALREYVLSRSPVLLSELPDRDRVIE